MADDKLLDIMRSRGINPDGATTVTERTQRNLEALSVFNSDANGSFFQQQVLKRFNNLRRWLIRKKHDEQDKQKMQGQVELLLDDWAFHHGGPPKTPSEQANCIEDVHERMRQIGNGVVSRKQENLNAPIEEAYISMGLMQLANVSYRLGRTLTFNPQTEQVIGDSEAEALLRDADRGYRAPYTVPG